MNARVEDRVHALEQRMALLELRLEGHEPLRPQAQPAPTVAWVEPVEPVLQEGPPADSAAVRQPRELEDLLGGRLLALVGGLSVILGIAFFVALAVDQGWIGETTRVVLAGGGSGALFAGGVWLHERKGRSQAARAMVGAAIAGLFLTLTAATALYGLVPTPLALPFALGIGAIATATAVRWDSRTLAALGVGGTLLAPVLGNAITAAGMAFLAVAAAAAAGILVWRRWPGLAVAASGLTLAQVAVWALGDPPDLSLVIVLAAFAALNLAVALGYELRDATATLVPLSALLVPFGALVLGALGYFGLPHGAGESAGGLWLVLLAVAHAALAGLAFSLHRVSQQIGLVLLGAAVVLGDVAFGLLAHGWLLGVGWAASAVAFAVAARLSTGQDEFIQLSLGGQLALSVGHVLLFDAQPQLLVDGSGTGPEPIAALAAVVLASFTSARLLVDERWQVRIALDAFTMAALAYATAVSLDGSALLLAWGAISGALARAAQRSGDRVAGVGAVGFLALIAAHVLVFEGPPSALVYGLDAPAAAALGLALVAVGAVVCARVDPTRTANQRLALAAAAAAALVYLGSTGIVTLFQPGPGALDTGIGIGIRQQGQALLSAFWSACGLTALWLGLRANVRILRLGGLGLLCLATAKVFLYDLSTLDSVYRVASFIVLGLLLLTAAFAHQRMRVKTRPGAATGV